MELGVGACDAVHGERGVDAPEPCLRRLGAVVGEAGGGGVGGRSFGRRGCLLLLLGHGVVGVGCVCVKVFTSLVTTVGVLITTCIQ